LDNVAFFNKKRVSLLSVVVFFVFIELFLGGGGHLVEIYTIPLRMILFVLMLFLWLSYKFMTNFSIKKSSFALSAIIVLLSYSFVSSSVGILKSNPYLLVIRDLTPILFFLYYFIMRDILTSEERIRAVIKLMLFSAMLLSLVGISIYLAGNLMPQYRNYIYTFVNNIGEVDFRFQSNFGVFHKGYIFVLISSLILFNSLIQEKNLLNSKKMVSFVILAIALILSLTRGFWIAFLFSSMFIFLLLKINAKIKFLFVFVSLVIIVLVMLFSLPTAICSDIVNRTSDLGGDVSIQRRLHFIPIAANIFLQNPILGSGYGTVLPGDVGSHLEISYLDILMEQGMIGFMIWGYLIYKVFFHWRKLRRKIPAKKVFLDGLIAGLVGLLIVTGINPFINNPLGIGYLLIIIITLEYFERQLAKAKTIRP